VQEAITRLADVFCCAETQVDELNRAYALFGMQAILQELHGHVCKALTDRHANYLLQRIVESCPGAYINFVAEELMNSGADAAKWAASHVYGCRIVLRLFRHHSCDACAGEATLALMDEVVAHANELCCDKFGNFVIQEILSSGLPRHRHQIGKSLLVDTLQVGCNFFGSRIIEKALQNCSAEDSEAIAKVVLDTPSYLQQLMVNEHCCYVLASLLNSEQHSRKAQDCLQPLALSLASLEHGRQLLQLMRSCRIAHHKSERPAPQTTKNKSKRTRGYRNAQHAAFTYAK